MRRTPGPEGDQYVLKLARTAIRRSMSMRELPKVLLPTLNYKTNLVVVVSTTTSVHLKWKVLEVSFKTPIQSAKTSILEEQSTPESEIQSSSSGISPSIEYDVHHVFGAGCKEASLPVPSLQGASI